MPTRKEGFGDYSLGLWENVAVDTNLFGFLLRFFTIGIQLLWMMGGQDAFYSVLLRHI